MSVRRKTTPSYLPHKQSGRARAVWTAANGERHQRLLPCPHGSEESHAAHARLALELASSPAASTVDPNDLTMNELMAAYTRHAENHYRRPDGTHTSEYHETNLVARTVREIYGETLAGDFGPLALKATRQVWVNAGLSRSECNRRTQIARRAMKWAAAEEMIPAALYHGLTVVTGLRVGKTTAREMEPVEPVHDATVDATMPFMPRIVAGMVQAQRMTGMRPGEVCILRRADIDTGGAVWLYKPVHHKNAHRGKRRVIAVGPRAQRVLREFFAPDLAAYLFSPRGAADERRAERSTNRATPRWPSHMKRNAKKRKTDPERAPKERYTTASYARAIGYAVVKANKEGEKAAKENGTSYTPIPHWAPNQLRYSYATRVRKEHGLEAAQVMLGHSRADVTQIYAERNEALAIEVAAKIG